MIQSKPYQGPERRIHHIYVTQHTEYHVRRDVCVAVRRRETSEWLPVHDALRMRVEGHVKQGTILPMPGRPRLGHRIYFVNDLTDILTSPVVAIVRPPKVVVSNYPSDQ